MKKTLYRNNPDIIIFGVSLALATLGVVMVYSASALLAFHGDHFYFLKRHTIYLFTGLLGMALISKLDFRKWQKLSVSLIVLSIFLLVIVLLFGHSVGGARRWFRIGFLSFQPSELAKFSLIIFIASYLDRRQSRMGSFSKGLWPLLAIVFGIVGLVFLEKDLGTPFLLTVVSGVLFFVGGVKPKHLIIMLLLIGSLFFISVIIEPYRWQRVISFFNNEIDPRGKGYQLTQSLYAIGSGGLFGRGLGNSLLKQFYLPEPHTDFLFPILAEELGLIGTLSVLTLFAVFTLRGWQIGVRAPNFFGQLLGIGITFLVSFQAIFNIAVTTGMIPTKGLPLPFLSFGGSSLLFSLMEVGILLNISQQVKLEKLVKQK